ncbi:DUF4245 family protein [Leucobacter sp. gxy201]|uniref:DUF4245 family protein n=1 Tax=Leucobacter sp. gxy201 TaxID=2957200 RepID=UPI003DA1A684
MAKQKHPNVVAELGRPETPGETAARKAENSRLYRERKTVNNLVLSLLVTLGLVAVIFLMVPRGVGGFDEHSIDVAALAADAEPGAGRALAAPDVPEAWKAKQAVLRERDGLVSWRINYTTVDEQSGIESYAAVVQGFRADSAPVDEAWVAEQLEQQSATGTEQISGIDWTVYDHTDRSADNANMLFGLEGEWNGSTILVFGTDSPATIRVLATQVAESLGA